jgi:hypothetical protein
MPGSFAEETLERNDGERNNQIGEHEGDGALGLPRFRLLKQGQNGKQNENRARVDDLPLEMAAIRFVGAHARGRDSSSNSLARRGEPASRRIQLATV